MSDPLPVTDSPLEPPPKGALAIIFCIVLLDLLGFGIIIPLLPFYVQDPQHNPMKVTALFSIYSICQFIGAPVLGVLSDRHGRRIVLIVSQLGSAVGYVLLGVATQLQQHQLVAAGTGLALVYLSRIIDGFTGGNISTAQAYISDVTTAANRAKGMGMLGAAFGVGFAMGPFIGGVLGTKGHEHWPAYVAAALSAAAAALTFHRLPESRPQRPVDVEAWLHPRQFSPIFRRPVLPSLLLISFCTMAAFVMMESTIALFLQQHFGYGARQVGWYFAFLGLVIVLVQGGVVRRVTRGGRNDWPLAILGPALVGVGMLGYVALGWAPLLTLLLLTGAVQAIGRSLHQPTISSLISKFSDPKEQGTVFGLYHGLGSVARVVGPVVAGFAYPLLRNTGPFITAAVITVAMAAWTGALRKNATVSS